MRDALVLVDSGRCPASGPNALDPNRMSGDERIGEIGRILAAGVIRFLAQKSRPISANGGDGCLDFLPDRHRHADRLNAGEKT
jgi:hypothetical protein